ncbi:MAG: ATP-binding cassette domain-containing protein, partial [Ilumatobacter sp.]|nr:ATP-binding cassette domain-containing protein [Ilumatobacter sp.]
MTEHAVAINGASMVFNPGSVGQLEALRDIDLDIAAGDFVSLIGPSGCGKSTLLRLIANLLSPTAGDVLVNGKSAAQARVDQDYG